ncbi:hypothetical protein F511_24426 [Dorcoceras hygrometricum]|uniref:Uncharacterized protein n=1 Tax=Dorcoceras hygrometricum TaxID=472368 RepID=A0A2Z7CY71_9LAMI|nr:hypothetical protein F511_24426 [Dorcoceras hygrometricum]
MGATQSFHMQYQQHKVSKLNPTCAVRLLGDSYPLELREDTISQRESRILHNLYSRLMADSRKRSLLHSDSSSQKTTREDLICKDTYEVSSA